MRWWIRNRTCIRLLVCVIPAWPRSLSCSSTVALCAAWQCEIFSVMDTISYELVTALQMNYLQLGGRRVLLITHDSNAAVCLLPIARLLSLSTFSKHLFEKMIRGFMSY